MRSHSRAGIHYPNMISFKIRRFIQIAVLAFGAAVASQARANLIGETITASGLGLGPSSATIGDSVEFVGAFGFMHFDFADHTLTLTPPPQYQASNWFLSDYTFSGFDSTITGISLGSNVGFNEGPYLYLPSQRTALLS